MFKRLGIHLLVQAVILFFAVSVAGFAALVIMGAAGGVAVGVAPEQTFGMFEQYICPAPEKLAYESIRRSYHRPGESEPHVYCVSTDGKERDVTGEAILITLGLFAGGAFLA